MMWLMTKARKTPMRGIVKTGLPPDNRLQGFMSCSSLAPAMALRAVAALLSKAAKISALDFNGACGGALATSNESWLTMASAQWLMVARWVARLAMVQDFGCGFQSDLPSGTRSRLFRVFAIS